MPGGGRDAARRVGLRARLAAPGRRDRARPGDPADVLPRRGVRAAVGDGVLPGAARSSGSGPRRTPTRKCVDPPTGEPRGWTCDRAALADRPDADHASRRARRDRACRAAGVPRPVAGRAHRGRGRGPSGGAAGGFRRRPRGSRRRRHAVRPRFGGGRLAAACARQRGVRHGDVPGRAGARPLGLPPLDELPQRRGHRDGARRRGPRGEGPGAGPDRRPRGARPRGDPARAHPQGAGRHRGRSRCRCARRRSSAAPAAPRTSRRTSRPASGPACSRSAWSPTRSQPEPEATGPVPADVRRRAADFA